MYEMKPEYYTGIGFIDKEHARLFELAQETHDLLHDTVSQDKSEQLVGLISELINYTRTHFTHEEEFQRSINYPQLEAHAAQHRQFEDSLAEIDIDALENDLEGQNEAVEKLLEFLVNWLVNHIRNVDKLIAESMK
ncbi:MAG: bacteriohemerythrin [Roseburia sp.]|nr:bacteriohemerythrin [Roseburia sp.]